MNDRQRVGRHCLRGWRAAWSAVVVLGLVSCSETVSVETDILIARYVGTSLELTNTTTTPVYYFAADRHALAVADWAVCIDPDACDAVPPSSTTSIPRDEVAFFAPGTTEIAVYHWRLVAGQSETGYVADSIRMSVVPVR